jgi:hypothetical protein
MHADHQLDIVICMHAANCRSSVHIHGTQQRRAASIADLSLSRKIALKGMILLGMELSMGCAVMPDL